MAPVNIIIAGDLCPINRSEALLASGRPSELLNDLLPELDEADLVVANLECPLVDRKTPVIKNGPVLGASTECVRGLSNFRNLALGLANNHILDHGREGIASTLQHCNAAGITTFGAGLDLAEARKIAIVPIGGITIGLLAMADNERCVASENSAGANPLEVVSFVRQMQTARHSIDYLVVLLHGGVEHYPFPSPKLQETCRFLIEQGANAVICQHSHCAGCYENYRGGHIVYGQGNLLFDFPNRGVEWHRGFLVRLQIDERFKSSMECIPYTQFAGDMVGTRKMDKAMDQEFRRGLEQRSSLVQDEKSVRDAWQSFCGEKSIDYLGSVLGHGRILRRLNRNGQLLGSFYSEEALFKVNNTVQCDAHREVLLTVLDQLLQKMEREKRFTTTL